MPNPGNTGIILLGHDSSDQPTTGEVAKMAGWLYEKGGHPRVDTAFTGTQPRLETIVQHQITRLRNQYPHIHFALADYLGFEDEIFTLLEQGITETTDTNALSMMECTGGNYCQFIIEHNPGHPPAYT